MKDFLGIAGVCRGTRVWVRGLMSLSRLASQGGIGNFAVMPRSKMGYYVEIARNQDFDSLGTCAMGFRESSACKVPGLPH